jgi:hypothetical protein
MRHFVRHYVEMVAAMFLGMGVAAGALAVFGVSTGDLQEDAPVVLLLGMGASMTVPMLAWMHYRGHTRQPLVDMSAAMLIPTAGVIAALAFTDDVGALLMIEHVVMLPAMLVAMLARPREYGLAV